MTLAVGQVGSPLGPLLIAADERAVRLVEFASERRAHAQLARVAARLGVDPDERESPLLDELTRELTAYFDGRLTRFTTPCEPPGSDFQRRVWRELARIPWGATRSYAAIARAIGQPGASRAVGSANGANPISILLPCHRVVRSGGALGGYGGGLDRKRWLLNHEQDGATQRRLSFAS